MRALAIAVLTFTTVLGAQQTPYPIRPATLLPKIEGDNPEGRLAGVSMMVVANTGRIYVLEGRPCTVKMFDPAGKFIRSFARAGDGPGQCVRPLGLRMDDTSVTIVDGGPLPARGTGAEAPAPPKPPRLVAFSLDGKTLGVKAMTAQDMTQRPFRGGTRVGAGMSGKTRVVTVLKPGAAAPDTLCRIPVDLATIERSGRSGMGVSGFGDGGAYAVSGDSLLVHVDGYTGIVKWYAITESGAALKRTETMGMTGTPVSAIDVADRVDKMTRTTRILGPDGTPQPMPPGSIKMMDAPAYSSIATTLMFGSDGSLWISSPRRTLYMTGDPNQRYLDVKVTYTVFPPSGPPYAVRLPVLVHRREGDR